MLSVNFERGTFKIWRDGDEENHFFSIKTDGSYVGYRGKPVKRFPKGISDNILRQNMNAFELSDIQKSLFVYILQGFDSETLLFTERMLNAGHTNFIPNCGFSLFANQKTFKQWLKLARAFEEKNPHSQYTLETLLKFENFEKFNNSEEIQTLKQMYGEDYVNDMINHFTEENSLKQILKWMLCEECYTYYQIFKEDSFNAYRLFRFFDELISLSKQLNIKLSNKAPLIQLINLREIKKNQENEQINATLKKNQSQDWVFEDNDFTVIVPTTYDELNEEGQSQHNCLGKYWLTGYGNDLKNGKQNRGVIFIRRKSNISKSYITCDFNLNTMMIAQFLGRFNEPIKTKKAMAFKEKLQQHLLTFAQYN